MKYTAKATKYVFKNFWYIFPFAVIPAFFFALSLDAPALEIILKNFFSGKINEITFADTFRAISIFNFADTRAIISGIIGIFVTVICVSMLMAMLEKHMRIGRRTFNGLFAKLNDNLLSTGAFTLLLLAFYELWTVIAAAIFALFASIQVIPLAYVLTVIAFIGMHFVLMYAISAVYLWLPCMQITGFRPFEALSYSYQLVAPASSKIVFSQIVGLIFAEFIIGAIAIWLSEWWMILAAMAAYTVLLMIFCVRMQVVYFDRAQIDRADLDVYGKY